MLSIFYSICEIQELFINASACFDIFCPLNKNQLSKNSLYVTPFCYKEPSKVGFS